MMDKETSNTDKARKITKINRNGKIVNSLIGTKYQCFALASHTIC